MPCVGANRMNRTYRHSLVPFLKVSIRKGHGLGVLFVIFDCFYKFCNLLFIAFVKIVIIVFVI